MRIEVGKFYKMRNGGKARIYATDGCTDGAAIHGAVESAKGRWVAQTWSIEGYFWPTHDHDFDLISEWEEPKKKLLAFWSKKYGTILLAEEDSPLHCDFKACGYRRLPNLDQEQT